MVTVADLCRCHLPLDPPLELPVGRYWWPRREAEPGPTVRVVALYGADPDFLRGVREPGGWRQRGLAANHPGATPPARWSEVGSCWPQVDHAVVDVTYGIRPTGGGGDSNEAGRQ